MNNVQFTNAIKQLLDNSGIEYKEFYCQIQNWCYKDNEPTPTKFEVHVYGPEINVSSNVGPELVIDELQKRVEQVLSKIDVSIPIS